MLRAAVFHWLLFASLRTGWFLPDVALFHWMVLLCVVQHTFLRLSTARLGGSRPATVARFSFEVYRRLYELWYAGCSAALALAERSAPVHECVEHYRASKARVLAALSPGGESRALLYLKGSYLSAQLVKDCVQFHGLDPEDAANTLVKGAAAIKGLSIVLRASAMPQKLAEQEAADQRILEDLRSAQTPESSPRTILHALQRSNQRSAQHPAHHSTLQESTE